MAPIARDLVAVVAFLAELKHAVATHFRLQHGTIAMSKSFAVCGSVLLVPPPQHSATHQAIEIAPVALNRISIVALLHSSSEARHKCTT